MKIAWSPGAFSDRSNIFDYIAAENPRAAVTIDQRIETRLAVLANLPLRGRLGRVAGTRELVIARTPFIAVYLITNDRVVILRILHGARQWPDHPAD